MQEEESFIFFRIHKRDKLLQLAQALPGEISFKLA
jgi:hypothetical protein